MPTVDTKPTIRVFGIRNDDGDVTRYDAVCSVCDWEAVSPNPFQTHAAATRSAENHRTNVHPRGAYIEQV